MEDQQRTDSVERQGKGIRGQERQGPKPGVICEHLILNT